jgi:SAM-dependent methyltransferase
MGRNGFTNVVGYDPLLGGQATPGSGVDVYDDIQPEWEGAFDVVISNHVFEHFREPHAVFGEYSRLLARGGTLFLRTPLADSYAWRTYRADWVQLDAPRHLFVHTRASLAHLAERHGLRIAEVRNDSTAWNLYASAQYALGISIRDPRSFATSTPLVTNPSSKLFTPEEIDAFARRADELNRAGDGDQALVILEHADA